jgi:cytochrome c peroxidase
MKPLTAIPLLAAALLALSPALKGRGFSPAIHANKRMGGFSPGGSETQQRIALGRALFFDPALSASGKQSCASCHDPAYAYGPPNARAVQLGGPSLHAAGLRAVPSLRYTLARTPAWWQPRPDSLAERLTETDNSPRGGFGWDGRFNTLHDQAAFPLLNPNEMANTQAAILRHLRTPAYADDLRRLYGPAVLDTPTTAFAALRQSLEAFELGDPSLHPFSSRYDAFLDGKATLTPQEQHGLALFNDPHRGNCASCHISQRGADGSHPLFTDYQFEALGVPRNPAIPANRDPRYHDLGLCGPLRTDAASTNQSYCGMFKTPTLRNVAARRVFFHNGRFHTLREALEFYVQRDTNPARWYTSRAPLPYDDLPPALRTNVDRTTLPLTGRPGDTPVWSSADIDDVIAFLNTLTDADTHTPTDTHTPR